MRVFGRLLVALLLTAAGALAVVGAGCGFGLADDTGAPIPGHRWGWVCADGGAAGDAGCPPEDAGANDRADALPGDR
jgi:hypothetical protein